MSNEEKPLPEEDGITHINIFSRSKAELGKLLSNFAHTPIETDYGTFASIEAYWFWLRSDVSQKEERKRLRTLHGFDAKDLGSKLIISPTYNEEKFIKRIKEAFALKIEQHSHIFKMLKESELPFKHYYVYNGFVVIPGHQWQVEEWEELRESIKGNL
jgi:hypothetical protein